MILIKVANKKGIHFSRDFLAIIPGIFQGFCINFQLQSNHVGIQIQKLHTAMRETDRCFSAVHMCNNYQPTSIIILNFITLDVYHFSGHVYPYYFYLQMRQSIQEWTK